MATYKIKTRTGEEYYVDAAPDASRDDILGALRSQLEPPAPRQEAPVETPEDDFSFMNYVPPVGSEDQGLFSRGVSRNLAQTKSLLGDVVPATLASVVGADEYAKKQMEEAQAAQEEIARTNPPRYASISDIGKEQPWYKDILPFATEALGENLITGATMLFPAGAGAAVGRRLAVGAAERALAGTAEKRLAAEAAGAVAPEAIATEAARLAGTKAGERLLGQAASRGVGTGSMAGLAAGVFPTNIADTFQNIYEATGGELHPTEALIGGSIIGLLDMYSPASVVSAFRNVPGLKAEVAAKIAEGRGLQAGVIPFVKALATGSVKGIAREVPTEMAQEEVSILAEQIAGDLQMQVGPEEIDRILTAGAKAAAPGAAFGVLEGVGSRGREMRETERQQQVIQTQQEEERRVRDEQIRQQGEQERLTAIPTEIADLDNQILAQENALQTNPNDKMAQYERTRLQDAQKALLQEQEELSLPLDQREQLRIRRAEEAKKSAGAEAPRPFDQWTGEDLITQLGLKPNEAKSVAARNNLSINLKAPITGGNAENFLEFLHRVQPQDAGDIAKIRDADQKHQQSLDFISRVEQIRDNYPNFAPEAIETAKISGIKSNKFGAEFNKILGGRPLNTDTQAEIYPQVVAMRDAAVAAGNTEYANFLNNKLSKNVYLKSAAEGPVAAPTAAATQRIAPSVEGTSAVSEAVAPPEIKTTKKSKVSATKSAQPVAPSLPEIKNDYLDVEQTQGRDAAIDRLASTLHLVYGKPEKTRSIEQEKAAFADKVGNEKFGLDAADFGSYDQQVKETKLMPKKGKEFVEAVHGEQIDKTIQDEMRGSFGTEAKAFYDSLTPEEQQRVKDRAIALKQAEPDYVERPGVSTPTVSEFIEKAGQAERVSSEAQGRLDAIIDQVAELEAEGAEKNKKKIAALNQKAQTILRREATRPQVVSAPEEAQREYNKLHRDLRDRQLSLEEAETDVAKQRLSDRIDTIQNRLDEIKAQHPGVKKPSPLELSVAERAPAAAATPESTRAALEAKMGRDVNKVSITNTPEEAGLKNIPPTAKGAVVNGKPHLFTQNIESGREFGAFLHEVGDHLGMQRLVGEGNYNFLRNKVQEWAASDRDALENKIARAAMARIPEGTRVEDEALAYFVEEAVDNFGVNPTEVKDTATPLGIFFRKLLAGVKNILSKIGLAPKDLTAQDIVDLAYGAAHQELKTTTPAKTQAAPRYSMTPPPNPLETMIPRRRISDEEMDALSTDPDTMTEMASNAPRVKETIFGRMDGAAAKLATWDKGATTKVLGFLETAVGKAKGAAYLGTLSHPQITEVAEAVDPRLGKLFQSIYDVTQDSDAEIVEDYRHQEKLLERAKGIMSKVSPAVEEKFFRLYNESTLQEVDYQDPANGNHPLVREFKTLPKELQDLHYEFYNDYQKYAKGMIKKIEEDLVLGDAGKILAKLLKGQIHPYSPLFRRGDYWLEFLDPKTGEEQVISFETPALRREGIRHALNMGVSSSTIREFARLPNITTESLPPTSQFRKIIALMEKQGVPKEAINDAYRVYLSLFPNSSIMQNFRPRKGVAGFEQNPLKVYANVAPQMSRSLHHFELGRKLDDLTNQIRTLAGKRPDETIAALVDNMEKRVEFYRSPVQKGAMGWLAAKTGKLAYTWFLWGNVSSAIVNSSNLPSVVLPMLGSKYGVGASWGAMQDAMRLYWKGGKDDNTGFKMPFSKIPMTDFSIFGEKGMKNLPDDLKRLGRAAMHRVVTPTMSHELMEMRESGLDSTESTWNRAGYMGGWLFSNVERWVREVTLVSTYKLARKNGATEAQAIKEAIDMVERTSGAASGKFGPQLTQKDLGKLFGTFKRIQFALTHLILKLTKDAFVGADSKTKTLARKQLAGIFMTSWAFAGLQGLPFWGAASMLAGLLPNDDDEPDLDITRWALTNWGDMVTNGPLSQIFGADFSGRIGFGNMFFRSDEKLLADVGPVMYALYQGLGPIGGIAQNFQRAQELHTRGDNWRAVEAVLPSAVKNVLKSIRLSTEGAKTSNGTPIMEDISKYDAFMSLTGFSPTDLAAIQRRASYFAKDQKFAEDRRTAIMRKANLALENGDTEAYKEAIEEGLKFSASELGSLDPLTPSSFTKSYKTFKQRQQQSYYGIYAGKKMLPYAQQKYGTME